MVNWDEFDKRQKEIFEQQTMLTDVRRQMFDFPASDPTALLQKPMNPSDEFDGIITKDITTANFSDKEVSDVATLLTSAVALNEAGKLFLITDKTKIKTKEEISLMTNEERAEYDDFLIDYNDSLEAKKWLDATVILIRASASSKSAVSKAKKGWLGELFVTLKRTGEISAQFQKTKGGMFK